jgi:hypothetical protein
MRITDAHWTRIRKLFSDSFRTSFHYTFATVGEDGAPRATPVGSLILRTDRTGFFFDEYTLGMRKNLDKNGRVCILALKTSKWLLLKSLFFGKFSEPPAVRLIGTAGERRKATDAEIRAFRKRVSLFRMLRGHDMLWKDLKYVRDIAFDSFEPVHVGALTIDLWKTGE